MKKLLHSVLVCGFIGLTSFTSQADATAYGYLFGSKTGKNGFVSFDKAAPQTLNLLTSNYGYSHLSAGEYVDGKIYGYLVEFGDFTAIYSDRWVVYDGETYKQLASADKSDGNRVTDMAYDYTTNTMYALVENKYTTGVLDATTLCIVDMSTGDYQPVGPTGEITAVDGNNHLVDDALITLACDADGQLYAMSAYRYLYKVDKHSGAVSQAAPRHNLGTAAQFQSMAFDADGKLWWAQTHPSYGHFCEIDLETGVPGGFVDFRTDYDKLNKLGDDAQVTALYFKDKSVNSSSLLAVDNLTSTVADGDIHSVVLSWVNPQKDYSGTAANVQGVKIYRLGTSEEIGEIKDGITTTFTDTEAPDGIVCYEVIAYSESGYGFPALTKVFAGADQLTAVRNLTCDVDGHDVTLSWDKPTSTVNGGYADFDAITYNVYRVVGDTRTQVGEGLTETAFEETLPADGTYSYVVEPVSCNIVGESEQTEPFQVATSATKVPYYTSFEDEENGNWSIVNKYGGNTGWSFQKDSYSMDGKFAKAYTGGSAQLGDDWLFSPMFELEAGTYEVDFYANGSSFDTQTLDVLVGTDKDNIESFTIPVISFNNEKVYDADNKGWKHIETGFEIAEAGNYYLAFHNKNQVTYAYFKFDNLTVKPDMASIGTVVGDGEARINVNGRIVSVFAPSEVISAEVYDLQGRAVTRSNSDTVDCSVLNQGLYIVEIKLADGSVVTEKILLR